MARFLNVFNLQCVYPLGKLVEIYMDEMHSLHVSGFYMD